MGKAQCSPSSTHAHISTVHRLQIMLKVVKVEQIRAVLFALFTRNNRQGDNNCQAKELV